MSWGRTCGTTFAGSYGGCRVSASVFQKGCCFTPPPTTWGDLVHIVTSVWWRPFLLAILTGVYCYITVVLIAFSWLLGLWNLAPWAHLPCVSLGETSLRALALFSFLFSFFFHWGMSGTEYWISFKCTAEQVRICVDCDVTTTVSVVFHMLVRK